MVNVYAKANKPTANGPSTSRRRLSTMTCNKSKKLISSTSEFEGMMEVSVMWELASGYLMSLAAGAIMLLVTAKLT